MKKYLVLFLLAVTFTGCAHALPRASEERTCQKPSAVIEVRPMISTSKNNFALGAKHKRHPSAIETIF